jgi:hypothetical protein
MDTWLAQNGYVIARGFLGAEKARALQELVARATRRWIPAGRRQRSKPL